MIACSNPLRVLPCIEASVRPHSITFLRSTIGVETLAIAPVSTLVYRTLNDDPDAIVIVTEDVATFAGQNDRDLIEVFSSTPTVLLSGRIHAVLRKRAAALHIRSVLPLDVTSDQLFAAIQATVAGLAVTLEALVQMEEGYAASNNGGGNRASR